MAQIRYHNYSRQLLSFDENLRILGLVQPGRVCGFDKMVVVGGTTIRIQHDLTGLVHTGPDGTAQARRGVVQSRQGVLVHENAYIEIIVDLNTGNPTERIDTLVMSHLTNTSPGGVAATYSVIKGATNTPFPSQGPGPANPLLQVEVGRFVIPAGAVDHTGTVWDPAPVKMIGGLGSGFSMASVDSIQSVSSGPAEDTDASIRYEKNDFNRMIRPGVFHIHTSLNRPPATGSTDFFVIVLTKTGVYSGTPGKWVIQLACAVASGKTYTRASIDAGSNWSPWINHNNPDVETSVTALQTAVGNLNYPSNVYVTDSVSVTTTIGALDAALAALASALSSTNTNVNNLQTAVGNQNYPSNNYVTDGTSLTTAVGALDAAILAGINYCIANLVKQGGGSGMLTNTVYIGWSGGGLLAQVDASPLSEFLFSASLDNNALLFAVPSAHQFTVKGVRDTNGIYHYPLKLTVGMDMDAGTGGLVAHGLTLSKINAVHVLVQGNSTGYKESLYTPFSGGGGNVIVSAANIQVQRVLAGAFDSPTYNAATITIVIDYEA